MRSSSRRRFRSRSSPGRCFTSGRSGSKERIATTRRRSAASRSFSPGTEYSEKRLLDFQERILKLGLFEGASVEVDASGPPEAAPVVVKVKELSQHQATVGVGYSANTGPRVSLEHWDRKVFGQDWIAHTTLTLGPDLKSLGTEFTAYPDENLWRKLAAASIEQLRSADETRNSWSVRAGRSKDTTDFERLYYLEASYAKVRERAADDVEQRALPQLPVAAPRRRQRPACRPRGRRSGCRAASATATERASAPMCRERRAAARPFLRAYARFNAYRPVGSWFANARVEAGQVFVSNPIAVPDPILFRAGGDNSVRGYDYRTLGPTINGAVVGGRVLLTGSLEFEHALLDRLAGAARRRVRRRRRRRRPLERASPGVRLRRRPALPQPRRAAASRRRLRPGRSPGAPARERRRRLLRPRR